MRIAPPDDNVKIQKLNQPSSAQGAETRPVEELSEIANTPPIEENHEHIVHVRDEERRQGERRQKSINTTLDTRSGHDRRTQSRRSQDQSTTKEDTQSKPTRGIDVRA